MDRIEALRAWSRVVALGSMTAAAKELRMSPSTVSKWVSALEEELGEPLLRRSTRAVSVTEAGERLYARAQELLATWDQAVLEVKGAEGPLRGRLRVSAPVVFGERFVAPLLPPWLERHPEVELELLLSDRYVNLVEEGVDLAVRVGLMGDSSLRSTLLARSSRVLVASPSYVAAQGAPERPEALSGRPCLLHRGLNNAEVWIFSRGEESVAVPVSGRLSCDHSQTLLELAAAGQGIALLADWLVGPALRAGRVVALLPGWGLPPAPVRALVATGRHPSANARALIEHLKEGVAPLLEAAQVVEGEGRRR